MISLVLELKRNYKKWTVCIYSTVINRCGRCNRITFDGKIKILAPNMFFAEVNPFKPSTRDAVTPPLLCDAIMEEIPSGNHQISLNGKSYLPFMFDSQLLPIQPRKLSQVESNNMPLLKPACLTTKIYF